ncbi:hypothetical protein [Klenkia taihuensis]|uniref:Uncharacterized protein n=1 Tax=Klenkia taihuensis TaxID=1225127 RepID=A0A1I1SLJ9_9ACTN|nr:hypothetical protein [Klenkia taihuensis]GHE13346.1 hypothetical protein GCM10011381_35150 [Klenkia taihuensis]SFD47326.1 hypothetical protein SAMN05661030_3456 [Klenkia taihuensis]
MPLLSPVDGDQAARVRQLHLVAAARVAAAHATSAQQVTDIVRVTVDDEVDTRTFAAIVTDCCAGLPRR